MSLRNSFARRRDAPDGKALPAQRADRRSRAIGLVVVATLFFTAIDTCAKWLVGTGMATTEVVFVRYAVHLGLVIAFALFTGERLARAANPGGVVLRGLFLFGSTALNFWALNYLPLTMTSAIFFTSPLWVCLLSIPVLGERVGPRRWVAIAVGFCGILIATRPLSGEAHWAVLLSIGAAFCAAFYAILTRMLSGRDSTATQQFYAALVATVGTAPLALSDWTWPQGGASWLAFALIGVFGWLGHQLLTIAHRFAAASAIAPFVYVQIVYMASSGWLFFGDAPDVWVLVGAGVVVASGLYVWLREQKLAE